MILYWKCDECKNIIPYDHTKIPKLKICLRCFKEMKIRSDTDGRIIN